MRGNGVPNYEWLSRTQSLVQHFYGEVAGSDGSETESALRHFLDALPPAPDAFHSAVLSTLLMQVCQRIVDLSHRDVGAAATCSCARIAWAELDKLTRWYEYDPRRSFEEMADTVVARVRAAHPLSPAVRATVLIRNQPQQRWTIRTLSSKVGVAPSRLRSEFQRRHGMPPAKYLHLVRVTKALDPLRSGVKVESVAWEVGYRSKKDLYTSLARWARLTPRALRRLTDNEFELLHRSLRIRCLRPNSRDDAAAQA